MAGFTGMEGRKRTKQAATYLPLDVKRHHSSFDRRICSVDGDASILGLADQDEREKLRLFVVIDRRRRHDDG